MEWQLQDTRRRGKREAGTDRLFRGMYKGHHAEGRTRPLRLPAGRVGGRPLGMLGHLRRLHPGPPGEPIASPSPPRGSPLHLGPGSDPPGPPEHPHPRMDGRRRKRPLPGRGLAMAGTVLVIFPGIRHRYAPDPAARYGAPTMEPRRRFRRRGAGALSVGSSCAGSLERSASARTRGVRIWPSPRRSTKWLASGGPRE
jgi:hypothetical protein